MEAHDLNRNRGRYKRTEVRRIAQSIHHDMSPLNAELWRAVRQAKKALTTEIQAKRESSIRNRLSNISLEQLAQKQHVRQVGLQNLKARGVKSAIDVLQSSAEELATIPDIGLSGAERLVRRAQELSTPRGGDAALSSSIDLWDGADQSVSRALVYWSGISQLNRSPSVRLVRRAALASDELIRLSSWFRWPFLGTTNREDAYSKAYELDALTQSSELADAFSLVQTKLKDLEHHRGVPVDRRFWARNSVDLLTELEEFHRLDDGEHIAQVSASRVGELDQDLVARMNSLVLNTALLRRRLRHYQEVGARFCVAVGSGLLGDDMGLGKTTQALAAIAHLSSTDSDNKHLVVCPAALLFGWRDEARLTVPDIRFQMYRGSERQDSLNLWLQSGGILAVSYDLSTKLYQHLVERHETFALLVADEAHAAKDPSAKRSKALRHLGTLADRTLLMTGTPLVNEAADMINLIGLVDPDLAIRLDEHYGSQDDVLRDAAEFRAAISSRYLRRKQSDVLTELPPLTLVDVPVELSRSEIATYKDSVTTGHLTKMRIAASSQSKMAALREIANEAAGAGRKMLVFSEYLDVLAAATAVIGSGAILISGTVSENETSRREAEFREADAFSALVHQIRKGGTGKNFQEASIVVLCEPQYTPAAENQAIARAHRMGQTESVVCYRLIATGTVDERLVQILGVKTELINELSHDSDLDARLSENVGGKIDLGQLVRDEQRLFGLDETGS